MIRKNTSIVSDYKCRLMGDYLFQNSLILLDSRTVLSLFSASVTGSIFMLGKFSGNKSFRIETASPFSTSRRVFNF